MEELRRVDKRRDGVRGWIQHQIIVLQRLKDIMLSISKKDGR